MLLVGTPPTYADAVHTDAPESVSPSETYLIYLHGRIVENAAPRPTDPLFALYDHPAVLEALASRGAGDISPQRSPRTDVNEYAGTVVSQVEALIVRGVAPWNIVIAGYSKGGAIASGVSSFLRRPQVRIVLLAACPEGPVAPCV